MNKIVKTLEELPSPCFVCEEDLLKKNLELLKKVQDESGAKILLALKGFALWSTFDLCREYLQGCCASGLNEAILAKEEFKKEVHTYAPAFKEEEIDLLEQIVNDISISMKNQIHKETILQMEDEREDKKVYEGTYRICGTFSSFCQCYKLLSIVGFK